MVNAMVESRRILKLVFSSKRQAESRAGSVSQRAEERTDRTAKIFPIQFGHDLADLVFTVTSTRTRFTPTRSTP